MPRKIITKIKIMNKYYLFFIMIIFSSCKNEKEEERENIQNTLKTHLTIKLKEFEPSTEIDTLRIIKINRISSKGELRIKISKLQDSLSNLMSITENEYSILKRKVDQYKTLQYMNSLASSNDDLKIFKDDIDEKKLIVEKSLSASQTLKKEFDSLTVILKENKTDSLNFLFYNITYKACFTNNKLEQKCFDTLYMPITKNFRIYKN